MAPASSKELLDIEPNYRVWIHSETRMWHDYNIQLKTCIIKRIYVEYMLPVRTYE